MASARPLLFVVLLIDAGCSSRSSTSDSPPGSCSVDPIPPSSDDFCEALAHYDGRCGHCDDCIAKNLQNCGKLGSAISSAYREAWVACKDTAACSDNPPTTTCIAQRMQGATPSAAQLSAKKAYCDACSATNASDCENYFGIDPASGKSGAGYNILLYSDDVVAMASSTCASTCDPFHHAVCIALRACGSSGGDYCDDGGLCAPR
jgi:hypothetical protein